MSPLTMLSDPAPNGSDLSQSRFDALCVLFEHRELARPESVPMEVGFARELPLHTVLCRVTKVLGPTLCRKLIVGNVRRELARELPANVISCDPRARAAQALQGHCRLCGRCKLSRE